MAYRTISILGCGWLGKALGADLVMSGCKVTGSTTDSNNFGELEARGILPVLLRIGERELDNSARQFFNSDILVISLPQRARVGKAGEYVGQIREITTEAQRGNVRNIILISTTSVYPNLNRVVTEDDADPNNPIVQAEATVRESGISNSILRFSGLFGPGRHPGKFLAGKQGINGGDVPVNMIHLDDCIGIIKRVIKSNAWNLVLNACADEHPARRVFYTNAAVALGLPPPVFTNEAADFKIVSNARLTATLNYTFIHRLM